MIKVKAFVTHGKWKATCPECGSHIPVKTSDKTFVCYSLHCYPELLATKMIIAPGKEMELKKKLESGDLSALAGLELVRVADDEKHRDARARAKKAGREYELEFTLNPNRINSLLRVRPIQNMNWVPGETLKDLARENSEHGLAA